MSLNFIMKINFWFLSILKIGGKTRGKVKVVLGKYSNQENALVNLWLNGWELRDNLMNIWGMKFLYSEINCVKTSKLHSVGTYQDTKAMFPQLHKDLLLVLAQMQVNLGRQNEPWGRGFSGR